MSSLKIREATLEDARIMFDLGVALKEDDLFIVGEGLPETVDEEKAFLEYITPEKTLALLAVQDGICVGNTITNIGPFQMNRHTADIGIGVMKGHRGKGIGTKLMEETMKILKKRGVTKVTVSVFAPNKDARKFYEKMGFLQEGMKEGQWLFKGEYIDEIIMAKWL
jgi:ribosomal protein S18 acetylase RimI-like enzyme